MQIEYIFAGCFVLLGFFMPFLAYRKGIKEGYELAKGKVPEPIKTPVKAVQNIIKDSQNRKETNEFVKSFNNLMAYDGNPQGGDE